MILTYLFSFAFFSKFTQSKTREKPIHRKLFTYMTYSGKEYKLSSPYQYINQNTSIFRRFYNKIAKSNENDEEGSWYYVHFLIKDLHQLSKTIGFTIHNAVIKNTFMIYLKNSQLKEIKDVSLIAKIEPSEKINEDGGPFENIIYFVVSTKPGFLLPPNPSLYTIIRKNNEESYLVLIEPENLEEAQYIQKKKRAAQYLSLISEVKSVSTYSPPKVKNNLMTGYTQKNTAISNRLTNSSNGQLYLPRYVNNHGINGEGEIITIQDTPIDFYHSMFYDPSVTFQLNKGMPNHRKIIYYGYTSSYTSTLSRAIEENEHGTHVAGTTAGKSNCQNDLTSGTSLYNGNAPDAKILYAGGLNDVSSSQLERLMKTYNSTISTNSWGVDGYNDRINYEYGKLAYNNPNYLFLFAAGNEYDQGNFTVCDPGGSKNVLTVGAMGDFLADSHRYRIESLSGSKTKIEKLYTLLDADPWIIGSVGSTSGHKVVIIDATKGSQCNLLYGNWVTILYAKSSSDLDWVFDCKQGDTSGILYCYNSALLTILNDGGNVKIEDITTFDDKKGITHADYSSGGPGNKGILKPDIMTPGTHITSAKSRAGVTKNHGCRDDNEADFTYMQGTSMATPNAAGAVALVVEYFKKKWPYDKVQLDGVTMRALMINSCKHPHNTKTPDILFGHGLVDLSTILPFDNSFGVQITNPKKLPSISESSHYVAQIEVKSKKVDFQVTMSYLDPMLEQSSIVPLTRDLDLVVTSKSGKRFIGDHLESEDAQHFSTNEKVIIRKNEIEVGTYLVHIYSNDYMDTGLSTDRQTFSVVATGDIDNKYMMFGTPVVIGALPTPTPTSTPTATASRSPRATRSPSPSRSPSPTASRSPSLSRTPTASAVGTPPLTETPTASASRSPTATASKSPTASASKSPTATASRSPTESPTRSATQSPTASASQSPMASPTQSDLPPRSPLGTPYATQTPTPTESALPSMSPSMTPTPYHNETDNYFIEISCPCDQCDQDNPTECKCDDNHIGSFCQAEITVTHDTKTQFTVASLEVKRVKFISKKDILSIKSKASSFFDNVTLWYDNDCYVSINEYGQYTKAGVFLSRAVNLDSGTKTVCIAIFNNNYESASYTVEVSEKKSYTGVIVGSVVGGVAVAGIATFIVLFKKGKIPCCGGKAGVSNDI
ncbi:hypothetical protein M9Y10_025354 [Tritrichomonas musculus]|uniref:Peptidase S8/S53 domain-containing protein n=1 Tax=Tritrichomonas musculus TaxID=1915356 RepID=A0ABR2HB71_9EUKA